MKIMFSGTLLGLVLLSSMQSNGQGPMVKRGAPKPVTPLVVDGVKYTAPADSMGYIVAFDLSGDRLWSKKIYAVTYNRMLETDVQDVYIDSIYLKDNKLYIRDERRHLYAMDRNSREGTKIP